MSTHLVALYQHAEQRRKQRRQWYLEQATYYGGLLILSKMDVRVETVYQWARLAAHFAMVADTLTDRNDEPQHR